MRSRKEDPNKKDGNATTDIDGRRQEIYEITCRRNLNTEMCMEFKTVILNTRIRVEINNVMLLNLQ